MQRGVHASRIGEETVKQFTPYQCFKLSGHKHISENRPSIRGQAHTYLEKTIATDSESVKSSAIDNS